MIIITGKKLDDLIELSTKGYKEREKELLDVIEKMSNKYVDDIAKLQVELAVYKKELFEIENFVKGAIMAKGGNET